MTKLKNMDKIDQKILAKLDKDPRIPLLRLAKSIRISQPVADYRVKRLIKQGRITAFGTIIDLNKLGIEQYRLLITFSSGKTHKLDSVIDYLSKEKGVYWAAHCGGIYDLLVVLNVTNVLDIDKFYKNFNSTFPGLIKGAKNCPVVEHFLYNHKYLSDYVSPIRCGPSREKESLSELDFKIINLIKNNARMPLLDIAKKLHTSYKTIRSHVKSLEEKKIITGYRLYLSMLGAQFHIVLISYKNLAMKEEKALLAHLKSKPEVTQAIRMFGVWDLFLYVRSQDNLYLQNILTSMRDKFEIIDSFEIVPIFSDSKINLFPVEFNDVKK